MWVCKFGFNGENILYGKTSKMFGLEIRGYNLSSYEKNKEFYVTSAGLVIGDSGKCKKAVSFLKKDEHVLRIEQKGDFIIILIKEEKLFKPFYSPRFVYVSPIIIKQGRYNFHIASWRREDIAQLLKAVEKFPDYKLLSLREERVDNISITGVRSNLTGKQKKAYDLAVENGYYEYPRKIDLEKLAKIMGISYSTYQQHLRYAERKLNRYR